MPGRWQVFLLCLVAVASSGGGFLVARHQSPIDLYAQEILACQSVKASETLMKLRHVEPDELVRSLEFSLAWDAIFLHIAIEDLPDTDPSTAHRTLAAIRAYHQETSLFRGDPEQDRLLELALASAPAATSPTD